MVATPWRGYSAMVMLLSCGIPLASVQPIITKMTRWWSWPVSALWFRLYLMSLLSKSMSWPQVMHWSSENQAKPIYLKYINRCQENLVLLNAYIFQEEVMLRFIASAKCLAVWWCQRSLKASVTISITQFFRLSPIPQKPHFMEWWKRQMTNSTSRKHSRFWPWKTVLTPALLSPSKIKTFAPKNSPLRTWNSALLSLKTAAETTWWPTSMTWLTAWWTLRIMWWSLTIVSCAGRPWKRAS